MIECLQGLLLPTSKIFDFFIPERQHEIPHHSGTSRTLMAQVPITSEVELDLAEKMLPHPHPTRTKRGFESRRFISENGAHCHFLRHPSSKSRCLRHDRNTSWIFFKGKSTKACSCSQSLTNFGEQVIASQQTGIGASENMTISQKYGEICDIAGHGSSGIVLLSHKIEEFSPKIVRFYAIKVFRYGSKPTDAAHRRRIDAGFHISSFLKHENIVQAFDLFQTGNGSLCECLEYCSGGDLHSLVVAFGQLEQTEADCFFKQLMHGINYTHKMGIAHCDLKPENLLLSSSGCLKISDFRSAECFRLGEGTNLQMSKTRRYPSPYISPEQYLGAKFDLTSVDIWAAAMIYIAMRTGRIPWKIASDEDECFRDYVTDCMIGRGYFFIQDICHVKSPIFCLSD